MSQSSTGSGGTGEQPADPNATVLLPGAQPFQPAQEQAPQPVPPQQPTHQDHGHQPQYAPQQHQAPQGYDQQQYPQQQQQYPQQQYPQQQYDQQQYDQQQYQPQQYDQQQYDQQQYQPQHGAAAGYAGQSSSRPAVGGAAKAIAGLLLLAAIVVAIGSVTTWVDAGFITKNGLDADGVITLPLAIIAAGFALARLFGKLPTTAAIVALVVGLLVALLGFVDSADVRDKGLDVGYGLWMVLAGGVAMVLISIAGVIKRR